MKEVWIFPNFEIADFFQSSFFLVGCSENYGNFEIADFFQSSFFLTCWLEKHGNFEIADFFQSSFLLIGWLEKYGNLWNFKESLHALIKCSKVCCRVGINGMHFAICKASSKMSSKLQRKEKVAKWSCEIFTCSTETLTTLGKLLWSVYCTII